MTTGILSVNKPPGWTSFKVVAFVKRLTSERRVGHAGTLDPIATGVLPILLGQATRTTEYLADLNKVYLAEIELGVVTDTYDVTGQVVSRSDTAGIEETKIVAALKSFSGEILQTPPMFSALKYRGKPLYQLARKGITVEIKPRRVTIHRIELISYIPPAATIEVECGKGTYIRSLAHDLGQALGCGAHLKNLVRLRYGYLDIKDAITVPELEEVGRDWLKFLQPMDTMLLHLEKAMVSEDVAQAIRKGQQISIDYGASPLPKLLRAYDPRGSFIAILRYDSAKGMWQPEKVFG
ncbi:MAG: tRNA pseudouridine(55) synthase TruB [Chloroflexota bacterium]